MTKVGPGPGHRAGRALGLGAGVAREVTTVGGNTPQWLVSRAASEIAAGELSVDPDRRGRGHPVVPRPAVPGPAPGRGRARPRPRPRGGRRPARVRAGRDGGRRCWRRCTSTRCSRTSWPPGPGRDAAAHAGPPSAELMAPFTGVAAANPYAWFPEVRTRRRDRHPVPGQPHRVRALHQAHDRLPGFGPVRRPHRLLAGRGPPGRRGGPGGVRLGGRRGRRRPLRRRPGPTPGVPRPSRPPGRPCSTPPPWRPAAPSGSTTSTAWTSTRASRPPCRWRPTPSASPPTTPGA